MTYDFSAYNINVGDTLAHPTKLNLMMTAVQNALNNGAQPVQALSVLDRDLATPPGSPSDGDAYIVAAAATGAWATHEDDIAVWLATTDAWSFITPTDGTFVWIDDEALYTSYNSGWGSFSLGAGSFTTLNVSGAAATGALTVTGGLSTTTGSTLASASGNVGIGIAHGSADGKLHVVEGSAGSVTANASGNIAVFEAASESGISVLGPDASTMYYMFGSPSNNAYAVLEANYDSGLFSMVTTKVGASLRLRADNQVTNLTLSGASGSELATFAGDIAFSGANPEILGGDTDGVLYISASTSTSLGANVLFYGDTHATKAGDIEFRNNTTLVASYDLSSTIWNFSANNMVTTGTFGSGDITIGNSANVSLLFSPSSGATHTGTLHQSADNLILGSSGVADYFSLALATGNITHAGDVTLTEGKLTITSSATTANASEVVADSLTTGSAERTYSNSADVSTRWLKRIHNDNAAATGTGLLQLVQDAVVSTNFKKLVDMAGFTLWVSDGTTANGALSGTEGDICINGGTGAGQPAYCSATGTTWVDM